MLVERAEAMRVMSTEREPREIFELYGGMLEMDARIASTTGRPQQLPPSLYSFLSHVSGDLKAGRPVTILKKDETALTTMEAASMLGVSLQSMVQLLEQNEIPFHMVGTQRRVYPRDVLAFKGRRRPARRKPQVGFLWGESDVESSERARLGDPAELKAVAWSGIKDDVRDDLLADDEKEPGIRLHALERLEKNLAALYPEFPSNPAVLLLAGKEEVERKIAHLRTSGVLHGPENDVLNHIFRRLEAA